VSAGRRNAYEALAHLLCELHVRLQRVGLVQSDQFELPFAQELLADALGLSVVHTNRMVQRLRRDKLVKLQNRKLTILNSAGLCEAAGFDPSYLHTGTLRSSAAAQ
jgi:CRP-like cAMP-binding protein